MIDPDTKRKWILVGGVTGAVILVVVLVLLLTRERPEEIPVAAPSENTPPVEVPVIPTASGDTIDVVPPVVQQPPQVIPEVLSPEEKEKRFVVQRAKMFTERFTSYSTQNNNQHIEDVLPLASISMQEWMQTQRFHAGAAYEGQSTQVIESSLVSFDGDRAEVSIGAQQQYRSATTTEQRYQRGSVRLEKINGTWFVDGLFWDK